MTLASALLAGTTIGKVQPTMRNPYGMVEKAHDIRYWECGANLGGGNGEKELEPDHTPS
jgi:hypothetical protein